MIPIPGRAGTQGLPRGWSLGFPGQNIVQRGVIFHITFVQKGHTGDNCNRKDHNESQPIRRKSSNCTRSLLGGRIHPTQGHHVAPLQPARSLQESRTAPPGVVPSAQTTKVFPMATFSPLFSLECSLFRH